MKLAVCTALVAGGLALTGALIIRLMPRTYSISLPIAEPARPTDGWQSYRSTDGGFEIRFPQRPEVYQDNGLTYARVRGNEEHAQVYLVSHSDHPIDEITARGHDSVLDSLQKGFVVSISEDAPSGAAVRIEQSPLVSGALTGRELKLSLLDAPTGQRVLKEQWAHVYIDGPRVFLLFVAAPSGRIDGKLALKFLTSFHQIPDTQTAPHAARSAASATD